MPAPLHHLHPPHRPWADRLGLRLYLPDRLHWRLAQDRHPTAPDTAVFANLVEHDLRMSTQPIG